MDALAERWNLLALLGQMSNIGMDMTETREGFQNLTKELLHHLGTENLKKTVAEMQAKAQVAVDIVIRNLFERTADIGFLATDDDFRDFIAMLAAVASRANPPRQRSHARPQGPSYPQPSGNELTTDISTFLIGGRLFGVESCNVVCSINDQQITPLVCSNPGFIGVFSYAGQTVGVISIHELLGMTNRPYNAESDGILLVKVKPRDGVNEDEGILGIVIDRIMDSPEIPNRSISRYGSELAGKTVLTKAVVRPDSGSERATMLSILDVEGLEERVTRSRANGTAPEIPLLGRDTPQR
ncbi:MULTISPECIES: chemotaxis protein CheW [Thiorhodovibrio]|uniref:chemotaxis protein CheW n=1 Tax=Thiorhodovibrio TaxID=61593 RepID=UPI001F5CB6F4|nr:MULTISPECIES: chemotaxis protein CheW [Thiorhodovibrio]